MKLFYILTAAALSIASVRGADKKPNVLFIAVDDLRPELGCYGNKIVQTPNFDRLAARGLVFNRAYVQQAVCGPSRTAVMTGKRPDATRVWDLDTHFRIAVPDVVTVSQFFKMNGYHAAGLGKIYHRGLEDGRSWSEPHWYPNGTTIDTDPKDWSKQIKGKHSVSTEESSTIPTIAPGDRPGGKSGKVGPAFEVSPKTDDELPDGATTAEAVRRLQDLKSKSEPFFLAVGLLKPHLPFVAPRKYWDLYDPNQIPVPPTNHLPEGAPEYAGHTNGELHAYPGVPEGNPIPADFAKTLRHGYYASISYIDAQIGRLLDALDKEGLADNTVIVLWGDHGWQLGEHGLWHKHTNYELAVRAPLIISLPQQKSAGQKCEAPVEFVDIYPTLTDVCGLPTPADVDGTSLKPFIANPAAPASKVAISQYPRKAEKTGGEKLMGYSIRDDRWRAIFWRELNGTTIIATELYDEKNDPNELVSVANKPENKMVLDALAKNLPAAIPPTDRSAPVYKKNKLVSPARAEEKSEKTSGASPSDRGAKFDKIDKQQVGRIARADYIDAQSDATEAATRFDKWDTDKDGNLTRQEFVTQGSKKSNTQ
jgi:iduronate 2-sulfatase